MRESDWGRAGGHTWPVLDCFPHLGMHTFGLLGIVCAGLSLPLDSGFCSELWKHDDDDDDDRVNKKLVFVFMVRLGSFSDSDSNIESPPDLMVGTSE